MKMNDEANFKVWIDEDDNGHKKHKVFIIKGDSADVVVADC